MDKKNKLNLTFDSIKDTNRFWYIKDTKLREELYLSFYYVTYLGKEIESNNHDCIYILFSIKHSIIIYFGSIIEAILFDYIYNYFSRLGQEKKKNKYCKTVQYKEKRDFKFSIKNENYVICEKLDKYNGFKSDINFSFLIKGAKDNKIIPSNIIDLLDKIREKRNSIHINVLIGFRDDIVFDDLNILFNETKEILDFFDDKYNKILE